MSAEGQTTTARAEMHTPCTRRGIAGDLITNACPNCGHAWLVHPFSGNPAVESCVLCRLEALIRE